MSNRFGTRSVGIAEKILLPQTPNPGHEVAAVWLLIVLSWLPISCGRNGEPAPNTSRGASISSELPAALPPHSLSDSWQSPNGWTVWLFIVVGSTTSEQDAWAIVNSYDARYASATILNIELFCDATYAAHRFVEDPAVTDQEYYSHVLYSFMRKPTGRLFHTRRDPEIEGQGSACK